MDVTAEAAGSRPERAYMRYAWIIFVILPLFHLGFGLLLIFAPAAFFDNFLDSTVPGSQVTVFVTPWSLNHAGAHLGSVFVGWVIMLEAVAIGGYRNGRRWSWYALSYMPVLLAYDASLHFPSLREMAAPLILLAVALLGLVLPFRIFFPKKA